MNWLTPDMLHLLCGALGLIVGWLAKDRQNPVPAEVVELWQRVKRRREERATEELLQELSRPPQRPEDAAR